MENRSISRMAGIITFSLFCGILILDYADQAILNPLLNTLLLEFFNDTQNVVPLGYVQFTFTILSALSMVIFGYFADRTSRRIICLIGCSVYSCFSIITYFTPSGEAGYIFFFITRAANGIGIGAIIPSIYTMVNDSVTTKNRATAFGILGVATLLGRMAGLIAAGTVANSDSSWRTLYFTIGLINLFLGLGLLLVKEPKRGSQDIELQETLVEGAEYNFKFKREDFKLLIRNKSNLWLILNFVDTIPGSLLLFLIFKYMEDIHNMQESAVNIVIIAVAVFGTIGTVLFGKVGDLWFQKDKRGKVIVALLCNATPMIFLGTFLQTEFWIPDGATIAETFAIPGAIIMVVSITIGMFINQGVGPNWMSSVVEVNLPEHRGTMIALANFADLLGNALGPLIGAYIASIFDIRTAMWSMLIFWLLNVLLWIPVVLNVRTDLTNVHNLLIQRVEILKKSE